MSDKYPWSEYQNNIFDNIAHESEGNVVVEAVAGAGKCLGKGTPVLMFDGTIKSVENIKPGELLMGPDSKPRKVLSTNVGVGPLYKVNPVKGDSWICNDEHILTLIGTNKHKEKIRDISVKDLLQEHKEFIASGKVSPIDKYWKLFRVPVDFRESSLEIEPYLLGLWIGDGSTTDAKIWSADQEIIDYCVNISSKYGLETVVVKEKSKAYRIRFRVGERGVGHPGNPHYLRRFWLKKCIKDKRKHIPINYLVNSRENRLQLLAGIIDTDGHVSESTCVITSTVKSLAEQYAFLARSLGFSAYVSYKKTSIKSLNYKGYVWSVSISGDLSIIPNLLPRKRALPRKQIKRVNVTGFTLDSIGNGDYYGFTLDGDGRFLLGDFTVTHNTSTIIEGLNFVPEGKSWLLVAFNKHIADELKRQAPSTFNGDIRTLHSLGLKSLYKKFPKLKVDNNKIDGILNKTVGTDKSFYDVKQQISKTVSLAKANLIDGAEFIDFLIDQYDIDTFDLDRDIFIEKVQDTLKACALDTSKVDFNDMIWFCNIHKVAVPKYHMVFVDEYQDLSNSQIELAIKACKRNGRVFCFGDPAQSIFAFAGANADSINYLKNKLKAKSLPLSISYRCPKLVVKEAQKYVPRIEAAPNAKDGIVDSISRKQMLGAAQPGSVIISRTNAPLVSCALSLIKKGVPAYILGKDIGDGLLNLIKKSRRKNLENFTEWLDNWEKKEIIRLQKKNRDIDHIIDKAACMRALTESCASLPELRTKIISMYEDTDESSRVTLSTTHKFKGLQRDIVYILWGTYRGGDQQERNLRYVALTRSARELYLVT